MNSDEASSVYLGERRLHDLLLETLDEGLRQVLGEGSAKVIHNYLETIVGLKWAEIDERPEEFSTELKGLLGSGASIIEALVLKKLYSKLQLDFVKREGYEFSDYIKDLRKGLKDKRGPKEED